MHAEPSGARPRVDLDLWGAMLAAAAVAWTFIAAALSGGSALPSAGLLIASGGALVAGRTAASVGRWVTPALVVGFSLAAFAGRLGGDGPLGYANASAALSVQASVAGLALAMASRRPVARALALGAALGFAALPIVAGSWAAAFMIAVLPPMGLAVGATRGVRAAVLLCATSFLFVLGTTVILGSTYGEGDRTGVVERAVDSSLTERRVSLWHEALGLAMDHPLVGAGPGRFGEVNADEDEQQAHNEFIQQAAETGFVGSALLVLLFLWGFAVLWVNRSTHLMTALGAVALTALGIHACVDYILHFPAVPIATAALVGSAQAWRRGESDDTREGPRRKPKEEDAPELARS